MCKDESGIVRQETPCELDPDGMQRNARFYDSNEDQEVEGARIKRGYLQNMVMCIRKLG
jgi:hypothetical protein